MNILIPLGGIQLGQRLVQLMPGWVILLSDVTALACSILSLCWKNGVFLTPHIPFSLCCQQLCAVLAQPEHFQRFSCSGFPIKLRVDLGAPGYGAKCCCCPSLHCYCSDKYSFWAPLLALGAVFKMAKDWVHLSTLLIGLQANELIRTSLINARYHIRESCLVHPFSRIRRQ